MEGRPKGNEEEDIPPKVHAVMKVYRRLAQRLFDWLYEQSGHECRDIYLPSESTFKNAAEIAEAPEDSESLELRDELSDFVQTCSQYLGLDGNRSFPNMTPDYSGGPVQYMDLGARLVLAMTDCQGPNSLPW